jgi:3-oxosteroid 1-dehydrogenase
VTETSSEFDWIVAGSGAGGLTGALVAAGRGLSVCVLEKGRQIGGGTATSYGTLWAPANVIAQQAGLDDSIEAGLAYARYVAGDAAIDELLETHVRAAPRAVQRLIELGVKFQLTLGLPEIFHPAAPGSHPDGRRMVEVQPIPRSELGPWADAIRPAHYIPPGVSWGDVIAWGGFGNRIHWDPGELERRRALGWLAAGQGLIAHLLRAGLALGVELRLDSGVDELICEDGRVCGVRTVRGEVLRARRGVLLATGGYEGNDDLVKRFEGLPDWLNSFAPTNTGDGMLLATELGASVYRLPVNHRKLVGCAVESRGGEFFSIGLHGMPYPGAIAVNRDGRRFCDESLFQQVVHAFQEFDRTRHRFVNLPAWMIFDDRHRQNYSVVGGPPGAPVPDWIVRANTLTELANLIDVDPAGLESTVSRFNGFVTKGRDEDFGRGASAFSRSTAGGGRTTSSGQLGALDTAPYYAIRLRVGGMVSAGVLTGHHGEVLHVRGHPIPGLYACGNAAAPADTGVGYQGGASIGSAMIFAYLAAEHAAGASSSA